MEPQTSHAQKNLMGCKDPVFHESFKCTLVHRDPPTSFHNSRYRYGQEAVDRLCTYFKGPMHLARSNGKPWAQVQGLIRCNPLNALLRGDATVPGCVWRSEGNAFGFVSNMGTLKLTLILRPNMARFEVEGQGASKRHAGASPKARLSLCATRVLNSFNA